MKTLKITVVAAVAFAAAAYALPADLVVISDREVRPDEAAGFYYLGTCAAGYLYNGSSAAVGRVAPYRILDRDAQMKDYYIVWAPAWVGVTPQAFAHLGVAVRLSEYEILVGLERGLGPGALRAVEHRIELIKLAPVTPVEWSFDGEAPPRKKDPRIAAAINSITAEEYAGYIRTLQGPRTRATDTTGFDGARDFVRNFFAQQNLTTSLFPFKCLDIREVEYAEAPGTIYARTNTGTIKKARDGGLTWETVYGNFGYPRGTSWLGGERGFVVGNRGILAKTADGGYTWEYYPIYRGKEALYAAADTVFFVDEMKGRVGGSILRPRAGGGTALTAFVARTADGGVEWTIHEMPAYAGVSKLLFGDDRHGWASVYTARYVPSVLFTNDGGRSWRPCDYPGAFLSDIAPLGGEKAWATDSGGKLLRTDDGVNWYFVETGVEGVYSQIEFPDEGRGYAAGSTLIATADGGASWRELAGAPEMPHEFMSFADAKHGVVADRTGAYFYRTDDGGRTFDDIGNTLDLNSHNVIGERLGSEAPEEIIIIGGHLDAVSDRGPGLAPGAEDDASGTACAMAAARAFRNMSFKRTLRYVAFGAEESGLVGSRAYAERCARRGEKIVAMLNADMVCYDEDAGARDDFVVDCGDNREFEWLFDYLRATATFYGNDITYERGHSGSDHRAFWEAGYEAISVIEGGYGPGGYLEYPYYHSSEDTLDKLHPELGVRFVRDYAAMLAHLAGVGDELIERPAPGGGTVPFARPFAVYPNPYGLASMAGGVHFVGVKSPATVELYDLAGRRLAREEVAAGSDECCWEPAAAGGEAVAPGVYLYRVEGQEQTETGKVVVVN